MMKDTHLSDFATNISNKRKGQLRIFTLIELLVVISILAILLTILLPALSKAKKSVKQISCASRQKQTVACFAMYADDHDAYYPSCHDPNYGWPNQWFMHLSSYADYPYRIGVFPNLGQVREDSIFVCPTAVDDKNCHDLGNNVQLGIGMSRELPPVDDNTGNYLVRSATNPNTRMINNPSARLLTADGWTCRLEGYWEFTEPAPTCYALEWKRHKNGANMSFCDGHVEWAPGKEIFAKGLAKTLYHDFTK